MKHWAFFMCIYSAIHTVFSTLFGQKTGIDTALNITNYKFGITKTEVVMKTQSILIQYFKVAAHCFANLLSVRAGLYVKQTQLPKQ